MGGRYTSSQPNTISSMDIMDYITLSTEGNAQDFGNLTQARGMNVCASSLTRGLCMGGGQPANSNVIDYISFSTKTLARRNYYTELIEILLGILRG